MQQQQQHEGGSLPRGESDEESSAVERSPQSSWRAIWQNNKGMFLILLAEITGSSMDAIVRFLQQGGRGMHPFQVWKNPRLA